MSGILQSTPFLFTLHLSTSETYRNHLNPYPSGFAIQLSIRVRSYPSRNALHLGTFGFTAEQLLTVLSVTHVNILTSDRLPRNLTDFPSALQNVLLP